MKRDSFRLFHPNLHSINQSNEEFWKAGDSIQFQLNEIFWKVKTITTSEIFIYDVPTASHQLKESRYKVDGRGRIVLVAPSIFSSIREQHMHCSMQKEQRPTRRQIFVYIILFFIIFVPCSDG